MMLKRAKISKYYLKKIFWCFSNDLTAVQTAKMLGLNRNTINRYYGFARQAIVQYQEEINQGFSGEIEVDESYFGKGKFPRRGRGTDKIPVFGIKKRSGRVYTQIIKNASGREIRPIINKLIHKDSTVYTDQWRAYDGLVLDGYKHYRINHANDGYVIRKRTHVNGIENFWSYAKRRMRKFNGIPRKDFYVHLKESEFRYNERENVYKKLNQILKVC